MNRRGAFHLPAGSLDDSMQADVMRFLAIIAICLLAVLALVRNATPVEPLPQEPVAAEPVAAPPAPVVVRVPDPLSEPPPPARAPAPVVAVAPPQPVVLPEQARSPVAPPAPAAADNAAEEPDPEPLSLRFASEHAFLALVNGNQVRVYAWRDGATLQLTPSFQFADVEAPGAVHEILPATLPQPVRTSFIRQHGRPTDWQWGVRLPAHTLTALDRLVREVAGGTLLIDARGEVRHASS